MRAAPGSPPEVSTSQRPLSRAPRAPRPSPQSCAAPQPGASRSAPAPGQPQVCPRPRGSAPALRAAAPAVPVAPAPGLPGEAPRDAGGRAAACGAPARPRRGAPARPAVRGAAAVPRLPAGRRPAPRRAPPALPAPGSLAAGHRLPSAAGGSGWSRRGCCGREKTANSSSAAGPAAPGPRLSPRSAEPPR